MDIVAVSPRIPTISETIIGYRYFMSGGGKGANQAFAVARLGCDVRMVGRVGGDDYGRILTESLRLAGCDIADVEQSSEATGIALISLSDAGENSIIVIPGANQTLCPEEAVGALESLRPHDFLLLQLETPLPTVIAAARHGRKKGACVILDPAPAPGPLPAELMREVDILTPNEVEAALIMGRRPGRVSLVEATSMAHQLREGGVRTVVFKLGALGCLLVDAETVAHFPAPAVEVVDTTAAGDVFNAALAVALSKNDCIQEACRFAVRAAAISVTKYGAQNSSPSIDEVNNVLT